MEAWLNSKTLSEDIYRVYNNNEVDLGHFQEEDANKNFGKGTVGKVLACADLVQSLASHRVPESHKN